MNVDELTDQEKLKLAAYINPDADNGAKFQFGPEIEQMILSAMIRERSFLTQAKTLVLPKYFAQAGRELICQTLVKYFDTYHTMPPKAIMKMELEKAAKAINKNHLLFEAELNTIYNSYEPELQVREHLLDQIEEFAKVQSLKLAYNKSVDIVFSQDADKWSQMWEILKQPFQISRNKDYGLDYFHTIEEWFARQKEKKEKQEIYTSGFDTIDYSLGDGGGVAGELYGWMGAPGTGKCFSHSTKCLMFDGTIKFVQDIVVGDKVMGPDSKPRTVLATHSLNDYGYDIIPTKGESYRVNGKHVLSLKNSHRQWHKGSKEYVMGFHTHPARTGDTDIYNLSVEDFIEQPDNFQKKMKGWRTGVDWDKQAVVIDPYVLGIWLGDGGTTSDQLTLRDLNYYNLVNNKHIPSCYKANSRELRLQLLAGLIDSDGQVTCGGFDFIKKDETLARDIVFLARSLGFAAYIVPCKKKCQAGAKGDYWRVSISGDCSVVPMRILRDQSQGRTRVKDVLKTGIKVVPTNKMENFYGFEVDGDHLFLLADFTVVHNSLLLVKTSLTNVLRGKKCLFLSLEMDADKVAKRFHSQLTKVNIHELMANEKTVVNHVKGALKDLNEQWHEKIPDDKYLIIKQFPAGTLDLNGLRSFMTQLANEGFKPDQLIVDYVGELKDFKGMEIHDSRQRLCRDLRALGVELQHNTWTALQPNRGGRQAQKGMGVLDDDSIGDSYGQIRVFDGLWSINQSREEKQMNVARIFNIKLRDGKCFAKGTPVLMFDGSVKMIENVTDGDSVMGWDSTPRIVSGVTSGREMMYRVTPRNGMSYTVNESHILSVRHKGKLLNISVRDFMCQNKTFKSLSKGWRTGVEYPHRNVLVNPYFLGLWLGDGHKQRTAVANVDSEAIEELNKISQQYDLIHNKNIPNDYMINDEQTRLQLLAGLMDSNGSINHNSFDFVSKNQQLVKSVAVLAGSLGLRASIKECRKKSQNGNEGICLRVIIYGDCNRIPLKVARKKPSVWKHRSSTLVTGITVEPVGEGEYYGFSCDGDHMFLLSDFTVVHNSNVSFPVYVNPQTLDIDQIEDEEYKSKMSTFKNVKMADVAMDGKVWKPNPVMDNVVE
jgi:replicative DNA helicase